MLTIAQGVGHQPAHPDVIPTVPIRQVVLDTWSRGRVGASAVRCIIARRHSGSLEILTVARRSPASVDASQLLGYSTADCAS
jgi:hypothetical protein